MNRDARMCSAADVVTHHELVKYLRASANQAGLYAVTEHTIQYRRSGDWWLGTKGRADLVVWTSRWAASHKRRPQWVIEVKTAKPDIWAAATQVQNYAAELDGRPVLVYPDAPRQWCKGVDVMSPAGAVAMFEHDLLYGYRNDREDVERFFGFHGVAS